MSRCSASFLASVALQLEIQLYAPNEVILSGGLHIMRSGVAIRGPRVMTKGSVWGVDTIIQNRTLRRNLPVRTITYSELYHLAASVLEHLTHAYPDDAKKIRFAVVKLTLQRGLVKYVSALTASNNSVKDAIADWTQRKSIEHFSSRADTARQTFIKFVDKHNGICSRDDLEEWLTTEVGYFGCNTAAKLTVCYYGFWNKPKLYKNPKYADKVDLLGFKKAFLPPVSTVNDLIANREMKINSPASRPATTTGSQPRLSSKKSFDRFFTVFKETNRDLNLKNDDTAPSALPVAGPDSLISIKIAVEQNTAAVIRVEAVQKAIREDIKMLSQLIKGMHEPKSDGNHA